MSYPVVAVVGSRSLADDPAARSAAHSLIWNAIARPTTTRFVSGGAVGPDSWGLDIARECRRAVTTYRPNWRRHGRAAGFERNKLIVRDADVVIAFWDGQSRGTQHDIVLAAQRQKLCVIYIWDPEAGTYHRSVRKP